MITKENLRLCGGTFFTLLLQARKPRSGARKRFNGQHDGFTDLDILVELMKVVIPDFCEPTPTTKATFRVNTSDFKSCKISSSTYLPFGNAAMITAIDNRVKTNYRDALYAMSGFISEFIDAGTSFKRDHMLVKALLELIDVDDEITDDQAFYVNEDGSVLLKADLRKVSKFCLQSFLLGVWHYILVNVIDNTLGQTAYDLWCPPNGRAERKYIGTIGNNITRQIKLTNCGEINTDDNRFDLSQTGSTPKDIEQFEPIINEEFSHTREDKTDVNNTTQSLLDLFEDAIDEFNVAEFIDNDYTCEPLRLSMATDVEIFVEKVRRHLRLFRRNQNDLFKNIMSFASLVEKYNSFLGLKLFCEDGKFCYWMPNNTYSDTQTALKYRCEIEYLYKLISGGGTLSVFGDDYMSAGDKPITSILSGSELFPPADDSNLKRIAVNNYASVENQKIINVETMNGDIKI